MCEELPQELPHIDQHITLFDKAHNFMMRRTLVMSEFIEISAGCSCGGNTCRRCIGTFIGTAVVPAVAGLLHLSRNSTAE